MNWHRKDRFGRQPADYILTVVLWIAAVSFIAPLVWLVVSSVKPDVQVFDLSAPWWPENPRWGNYVKVWTGQYPFATFLMNSVIVAGFRVVGDVFTSALAGFAFATLRFPGRRRLFVIYLSMSLVPAQLLLVPRFMLFKQLGLLDTLWALILPGIVTITGTFLLRQFFISVPRELAEAARIDGASWWRVFWQVYLPLARPILAALAILSFVWAWNDYESPLILLQTTQNFTIPIGLTVYTDENGGMAAALTMAASVCSIVPVVVVFLLAQRQFFTALSHSGIK